MVDLEQTSVEQESVNAQRLDQLEGLPSEVIGQLNLTQQQTGNSAQ